MKSRSRSHHTPCAREQKGSAAAGRQWSRPAVAIAVCLALAGCGVRTTIPIIQPCPAVEPKLIAPVDGPHAPDPLDCPDIAPGEVPQELEVLQKAWLCTRAELADERALTRLWADSWKACYE